MNNPSPSPPILSFACTDLRPCLLTVDAQGNPLPKNLHYRYKKAVSSFIISSSGVPVGGCGPLTPPSGPTAAYRMWTCQ